MKTSLSNYKVEASFTVYVNLRKCYPVQCRMQVIAAKTHCQIRTVRSNPTTDMSILTPKPRGKTREWTEEQMERAVQDVTNGVLGIGRAALEYQVP